MTAEIEIALITLAGTIISGCFSVWTANRLINYRLAELEKKVDKHNNLIDRTYQLEKNVALLQEEIEEKSLTK